MRYFFALLLLCWTSYAQAQQSSPAAVNGGIYLATPPTLTDKQRGVFQLDANGNLRVVPGTFTPGGTQDVNLTKILGASPSATNPLWVAPATAATPWAVTGSVQISGQSFTNITTNADTNIKASAGTLAGIVVNTAGVTSTIKLYNDADGTCNSGLIGTFSTTAQVSLTINAAATVGICATTTGGTPADVTVLWR